MPPVVDQLSLGPLGTNCYVVRATQGATEAVVVDPSGTAADIVQNLASSNAHCSAILITHGHFDHILGVAELATATGAPVHISETERDLLENPGPYTPAGVTVLPWSPSVLLDGGETLELAGLSFEVLSVPGHSPGHLAYHADGALLSGDVLFAGGVGRTDFPGGDWETLRESLRALIDRYSSETIVYPGHGRATTLGDELRDNPFLGDLRAGDAA